MTNTMAMPKNAAGENAGSRQNFIGYEYRDVSVDKDMANLYTDSYQNFGWQLDGSSQPFTSINSISMKFKRDRKIASKAELTRLQRQFDASAADISNMEKSKYASASLAAYTVGILGTAAMAGATFAYLGGMLPLCIVLSVPGLIGWVVPYFLYKKTLASKSSKLAPLIDAKYDEIYALCEKANVLLG